MCKFRNLKAEEIDVRISQIRSKFFSLLLYKDARCDMNILDETVGSMNWQRTHMRDNANCIVSLWDKEKQQWISKEDTGTESNTEKEKGLASDSFKRACFNWGIGRELYTSPEIKIYDMTYVTKNSNGKETIYEKFKVSKIKTTEDKVITDLEIVDSNGKVVFSTNNKVPKKENVGMINADQINKIIDLEIDIDKLCTYYKVSSIDELTFDQANYVITKKTKGKK